MTRRIRCWVAWRLLFLGMGMIRWAGKINPKPTPGEFAMWADWELRQVQAAEAANSENQETEEE